jgi:hypothetical protein
VLHFKSGTFQNFFVRPQGVEPKLELTFLWVNKTDVVVDRSTIIKKDEHPFLWVFFLLLSNTVRIKTCIKAMCETYNVCVLCRERQTAKKTKLIKEEPCSFS